MMLNGQYNQLSKLFSVGLGTLNPYTLIQGWALASTGDAAIIQTVLIANLPQLLLSFLYFVLNSLFTSMALAAEWSHFSSSSSSSSSPARGLRVTHPRGAQRSTYFLSLPYRLGLPLLAASTFLHWAVSQSIFVARIEGRSATGAPANLNDLENGNWQPAITTCGYSPFGIFLALLTVGAVAGAALALGRWGRLGTGGMPVAGSCSLAVAAACHAPEGTEAEGVVRWGVVGEDGGGVGHCAFSNGEVEELVPGRLYA